MSTTLCILLDTRRIKKSMKYPVKLRVTFERVSEYYQSIFNLSKQEFNKLTASRISNDLKFIRYQLKEIERTAQNAANKLDPFSFSDFEKDFIRNNNLFRQRKLKLELLHKIQLNSTILLFIRSFQYYLESIISPGLFPSLILRLLKNF